MSGRALADLAVHDQSTSVLSACNFYPSWIQSTSVFLPTRLWAEINPSFVLSSNSPLIKLYFPVGRAKGTSSREMLSLTI